MQNTQDKYRTSDLYYAAYQKVAGVLFTGTIREGSRVFFEFEHTEGLKDLKTQYFNRSAKVPAASYADEIRSMKALTHMAEQEGPNG